MCHTFSYTVKGESAKNKKLRGLQVMSMLKEYELPEMWEHVSPNFASANGLGMSEVLSSTNLPYLEYLLTSGATSDITVLE